MVRGVVAGVYAAHYAGHTFCVCCVLLGYVLTVTMEITVDVEGTRFMSDGADGVVPCVDRGSIHFLRWA